MSSSFTFIVFSALLLLSQAVAKTSFRPKALVLPVKKDPKTSQYLTHLRQRTPLVPVSLTLDLGGQFLWVDCEKGYVSSTKRPVECDSALCKLTGSGACTGCDPDKSDCKSTCSLIPDNSVKGVATSGDLDSDALSVQSTDGKNPGRAVSVSRFHFVCGATFLLDGLARGVKGMAGLGRTPISLPTQFSSAFKFPQKFAICLSSGPRDGQGGVVFFGDGPYMFLPDIDAANKLSYTSLIRNPVSTASAYFSGDASSEYFIGVKGIKINNKKVLINTTLLSINKEGFGGTKISTVNPYTVLETSIYKAVSSFFAKELSGLPRAKAVAPFEVCFPSKAIGATRVGPAVPQIELVLSNKNVWTIFGMNSMVNVNNDVLCLGFVDGGAEPRTSIVIGGHTIENNFLQFDLEKKRLGFSSSLLFWRTTCANFNFTSNA
ncbi:Nepenthesin [Bertholletia excelsa]